jgi:hypothetical protein
MSRPVLEGKRRNAGGDLGASVSVRHRALGGLAVSDREGHSHHLRFVGKVRPEPGEHMDALWLAHCT